MLERFAVIDKPLHLTEVTVISGDPKPNMKMRGTNRDWPTTPEGEARQAREIGRFYRLAYSHPSLAAITWWDFADGAWLGAPAGVVRRDFSPKPAYHVLRRLIRKEWWIPEQTLTTDEQGRVSFRAFLGDHQVTSPGGSAAFQVGKAGGEVTGL